MRLTSRTGSALRHKCDLLVLPAFESKKKAGAKRRSKSAEGEIPMPRGFEEAYRAALAAGDVDRDFGKCTVLYPSGKAAQKRVLLLGLGKRDEFDDERARRLGGLAVQKGEALGAAELVIAVSPELAKTSRRLGQSLAEGVAMGSYRYEPPKQKKSERPKLRRVALMAESRSLDRSISGGLRTGAVAGEAVCFARDLGNRAGNLLTPRLLAKEAKSLAGRNGIRVRVLDEAQMRKQKMGALLSVSRGSAEPARLIVLDYRPRSAKTQSARKTVCVVGKGLTFDAGGISLKPSAAMDEMRYDMCGGAAVLGLFHALANGAPRPGCRVVGIVGSSENLPDASATKPGDIVTASNGLTIEVLNTDAEGRLVLSDALAYAVKTYKPSAVIDLATLTGAAVIALGHEVSAAIGNDQKLVDEVLECGERSGDRCWQLPMWEVHREQMKSKFADLRNINTRGDGGGTIAGASFLSHFVGDTPWVHLDIAGTAWGAKSKDYYQAGATGVGVRVLLDWVLQRR
ncbi:MAG: leucyl aminopeptidase [Planctomycetota bacterium]